MVAQQKKRSTSMHSLTIREIPRPVLDKLQQRALLNHRSMQGEVLDILKAAADGKLILEPAPPTVADSVDRAFGLWRDTEGNTVTDGLVYEREIRRDWGE
jgi:plasmid stability protein